MTIQELFQNKRVLIFGLGLQGGGVADALTALSFGAEVRVTDLKLADQLVTSLKQLPANISLTLGEHREEDIRWADLILVNPAVPFENPYLQLAQRLGKSVYGSAALYLKFTSLPVIGITGTRGKSTTTNLIYQILNQAYPNQVLLGGNIPGKSPLQLLHQEEAKKYVVLELSSFQLHYCHALKVSPHLAVVTNIYPDHLNRYPSMEAYIQDKLALVQYQTSQDYAILNQNDPQAPLFAQATQAQIRYFDYSSLSTPLIGQHNRANIAAATMVAEILAVPPNLTKQAVANFTGLPFRLERVGEKRGVTFINDTTSTTPIATITAIKALAQQPLVLIVGGSDKGLPFDQLVDLICRQSNLKKVVILGSFQNQAFVDALKAHCPAKIVAQVKNMSSAVNQAVAVAQPGDVVLLSPGFASFDLFKNEFDRGKQFNEAVQNL